MNFRAAHKPPIAPRKDLFPADALGRKDASQDRTDKPKIKVTTRDKPLLEEPLAKTRSRMQSSHQRNAHPRAPAEDTRTPSHHPNDLTRNKPGARSGRGFHLELAHQPAAKLRGFQLRRDRQAYAQVWANKEETAKEPRRATSKNQRRYTCIDEDQPLPPKPEERNRPAAGAVVEARDSRFRQRRPGFETDSHVSAANSQQQTAPQRKFAIQTSFKQDRDLPSPSKTLEQPAEDKHANFRIKAKPFAQRKPEDLHRSEKELPAPAAPQQSMPPREETTFEHFDSNDAELVKLLGEYFQRVANPKLVQSQFCDLQSLQDSFKRPTWIRLWRKKSISGISVLDNKIVGVLIYEQDTDIFKSRRVLITHVSAANYADFDGYLREGAKYIFSKDPCTEIYVQFRHILEEDKLVFPNELKESAKAAGFRWRLMINSSDGSRLTVFEIKRPSSSEAVRSAECLEPIKVVCMSLLSQNQLDEAALKESPKDAAAFDERVPYDGSFLLFAAVLRYFGKDFRKISDEQLAGMGRVGELLQAAKQLQDFNSITDFNTFEVKDRQEVNAKLKDVFVIKQHNDDIELLGELKKTVLMTNMTAVRLRYYNPGTLPSIPFRYMRSRFEKRFLLPHVICNVYLLPTFEDDVKMFIIQLNSDKRKKLVMADFIAGLENAQEPGDEGHIWFPQFSWDSSLNLNREQRGQLNSFEGAELQTVCSRSAIEVSHRLDDDLLKLSRHEDDAFIQGEFVAGLLNKELLATFKIPLIMAHIKKDHYIDI